MLGRNNRPALFLKGLSMADADLFAFVLMPFEAQFDDLYRFGIKEPAAELGILAQRVDEQIFSEGILERIYRQILLADIIIAEMTGQNPNVFYEVGFAHGLDKLCILSTAVAEDIPFDLKHKRHIVHGNSIKTLRGRLTEELTWAKGEIENIQKSRLVVKLLKPTGDLEKTKHLAKGIIQFRIDMKNHSQRPSAEIEAVYFYSTKGWVLSQDGRNCPSTESDLPPFQRRHFLNSPVRRSLSFVRILRPG